MTPKHSNQCRRLVGRQIYDVLVPRPHTVPQQKGIKIPMSLPLMSTIHHQERLLLNSFSKKFSCGLKIPLVWIRLRIQSFRKFISSSYKRLWASQSNVLLNDFFKKNAYTQENKELQICPSFYSPSRSNILTWLIFDVVKGPPLCHPNATDRSVKSLPWRT